MVKMQRASSFRDWFYPRRAIRILQSTVSRLTTANSWNAPEVHVRRCSIPLVRRESACDLLEEDEMLTLPVIKLAPSSVIA